VEYVEANGRVNHMFIPTRAKKSSRVTRSTDITPTIKQSHVYTPAHSALICAHTHTCGRLHCSQHVQASKDLKMPHLLHQQRHVSLSSISASPLLAASATTALPAVCARMRKERERTRQNVRAVMTVSVHLAWVQSHMQRSVGLAA